MANSKIESSLPECMGLLEAFNHLQASIQAFCSAVIQDQELVAWLVDESSPREALITFTQQLYYQPDQAPREILVQPGFFGASAETIELAKAMNLVKDNFKNHVTEFVKTHKNGKKLLKELGFARLHLKQCYRKTPILPAVPSKISWTWANTRSIKKITRATAEQMLIKRGNDQGIMMQLRKLSALAENEPLAIVQNLAPHIRANLVYAPGTHSKLRQMVKGAVPLLFPADTTTAMPDFKPPKAKSARDANRVIRSDVRLDPVPYLPAIRAHLYVQPNLVTENEESS